MPAHLRIGLRHAGAGDGGPEPCSVPAGHVGVGLTLDRKVPEGLVASHHRLG